MGAKVTGLGPLAVLLLVAGCERPEWARAGMGEAAPPPPAWAQALIGKDLRQIFPQAGTCRGNTDGIDVRYTGKPSGARLLGWGWDAAAGRRIERVIVVDIGHRIVGAGEGGLARPDVPAAIPQITDPDTGWNAVTTMAQGPVDVFGVVGDGQALCPLGHVEL